MTQTRSHRTPPPIQLVALLDGYRSRGYAFQLAFELALSEIDWPDDRKAWRDVLKWAEPELRAAYCGEPTPTAEALARMTGSDLPTAARFDQPGSRVA